jgi:hypothetical protein
MVLKWLFLLLSLSTATAFLFGGGQFGRKQGKGDTLQVSSVLIDCAAAHFLVPQDAADHNVKPIGHELQVRKLRNGTSSNSVHFLGSEEQNHFFGEASGEVRERKQATESWLQLRCRSHKYSS